MSIRISPVGDKILVKPIPKKEEELDSKLVIPESVNADLREGEVVAVSADLKDSYKVGDIVLYPKGKGVGQLLNGREPHLWLIGGLHAGCEVWGIVNPKIATVDKGDGL